MAILTVTSLDAAREAAFWHLAFGGDPKAIIEARVRHARGETRFLVRADAWCGVHDRATTKSSAQLKLLTETPHTPRYNVSPKQRWR